MLNEGERERKRENWFSVKRNNLSGLVRKYFKDGNSNRDGAVPAPHTLSLIDWTFQ